MTSKRIAQTNQQQKSEKPQASGILQRAAVRSVSEAEVQSTDDLEAQPLSNSAFSKDFSRVPISTTKPQQIMGKLTIGAVGDKYEQEADRVAAQVVQRINAPASVRSGEDESVQREEMETKDHEAKLMRSPILQCRSSDAGMVATPDIEASINQARSSGQPLANSIREPMEQAFGADFRGVNVHTDAQSDQLNRSIQARAFTSGQDVFFRSREYNTGSRSGQELLAHELTHVVQQSGREVQRSQGGSPQFDQLPQVQRFSATYSRTQMGFPDYGSAMGFDYETIGNVRYQRGGSMPYTLTDGTNTGSIKHYVPSNWISKNLIDDHIIGHKRHEVITRLTAILTQLGLATPGHLTNRADGFDAWVSDAVDTICNWEQNLFRDIPSTDDGRGTRYDTPTTAAVVLRVQAAAQRYNIFAIAHPPL